MKSICLSLFAFPIFLSAAQPLSLEPFKAVHKAILSERTDQSLRMRLPSAEWDCGICWSATPASPINLTDGTTLALDVENLSTNRQMRLTLHLSGGSSSDSSDHAHAILIKNRSINTGIALNPREKGTLRLSLPHPPPFPVPDGVPKKISLDVSRISEIAVKMQWPFEDEQPDLVDCRLSHLRLEGTYPANPAPKDKTYLPFVDPYGQYAHSDWAIKIHADTEFPLDLKRENAHLKPAPSCWDAFGGWASGPQLPATGHFRTAKHNGKWWLVTPNGHLFFSLGIDVARIMTDLSDGNKHPDWYQTPPPPDGRMAFTIWNLEKKFGTKNFQSAYYDFMLRRFDAWGINTIGNWGAPNLIQKGKKPYVVSILELAASVPRLGKTKFYDTLSPHFVSAMKEAVRSRFEQDPTLSRAKEDPLCIGFFIDNELKFPSDSAYYEPYFKTCREILRELAPKKLYLGCRFVGFRQSRALWEAATRYCDVITVNTYTHSVFHLPAILRTLNQGEGVPILIGEFHFGCLDRGMFRAGLCPTPNQQERARALTRFLEGAIRHPSIVGCHWFQYRDQPLVGRGDGEAYQIGFVDVCDRPYPKLARAARAFAERLYFERNR